MPNELDPTIEKIEPAKIGYLPNKSTVVPTPHIGLQNKNATDSDPTAPLLKSGAALPSRDPMYLPCGKIYDDFFIRKELGRGAFGVVYLAEQLTLNRTVALKITDINSENGCDHEGQTMAQLAHKSIVRIYSQSSDNVNSRRILCMQYVAGMNLRKLILRLRKEHSDDWQGKDLLRILSEENGTREEFLSETSLADRAFLERANKLEAICWIGSEAAFALQHAHDAGYVHRDVKPENTIVSRSGRPMLVDFNLAVNAKSDDGSELQGGTLAYMPPEVIKAFTSEDQSSTSGTEVDIYALGILLWELACGKQPFAPIRKDVLSKPQRLQQLLLDREVNPTRDNVHPSLIPVLFQAFDFSPKNRFESAKQFAETLQGVACQENAIETRSSDGRLGRSVVKHPISWLLIAGFLPHVVASGLQIAYNQAEIVSRLNEPAQQLFFIILFYINPIVYGICGSIVFGYLFFVSKQWRQLNDGDVVENGNAETAREKILLLPSRFALIGSLGWLAGSIAFPAILYNSAHQFAIAVWFHFIISFAVHGSIAVTFSYALSLAVVIYGFYPTHFASPYRFAVKATRQLKPLRSKWAALSILAGLIPLAAAILVVTCSRQENFTSASEAQIFAFKALVTTLILSSVIGFGLVHRTGQIVTKLINECTRNFGQNTDA